MDPDANLAEQVRLATAVVDGKPSGGMTPVADRLAELVLAMDEWIRGGGFLPAAWSRAAKGGK